MTLLVISETKKLIRLFGLIKSEFQTTNTFKILKRMFFFQRRNFGRNAKIFKFSFKQVRPNDVWTCVACSYFIYKKLT